MTPARYDLVQVIAREAAYSGFARHWQSELWKALGVSRATVSRMLAALEKLGYVRRSVVAKDRRHRWVELTRAGAAWFRLARRVGTVPAELAARRAVRPRLPLEVGALPLRLDHVGTDVGAFETLLFAVQRRFGGSADWLYGAPRDP